MSDMSVLNEVANLMTPQHIVQQLDRYVVGQSAAKKKVAISLRHRLLRKFVPQPLQQEITPKNILMIGPTGVGKTEIVRRLAQFIAAPFIKVEATKFTEVGYVGRDVESIIRDLVDKCFKEARDRALKETAEASEALALERIAERLKADYFPDCEDEVLIAQILAGEHDALELDIEVNHSVVDVEIMAPPGMEEMTSQLQQVFQSMGSDRRKKRNTIVSEALKIFKEEESMKALDEDVLKKDVIHAVEEQGIVFIDEIDKVCQRGFGSGDVSREGVQRDLLPLIEGCSVATRYGTVCTDHILFITSGAFILSKPSDLIAELQGRLPIRVELLALTESDFVNILSSTDASLISQYQTLLSLENVQVTFELSGIQEIAKMATEVNERLENIGARRLHTVMEKLLEDVFYEPGLYPSLIVDSAFVQGQLSSLLRSQDLYQYVL